MARKSGSLRKRRRRARRGTSSGGMTLYSVSLAAFGTFCVIILVAIYFGQQGLLFQVDEISKSANQAMGRAAAARVAKAVDFYTVGLRAMAADPAMVTLLNSRDKAAMREREKAIQAVFPGAQRARIIPAGQERLDKTQTPHVGFACLDLISKAAQKEGGSPLEVHVLGTPQQHIGIVQPVISRAGKKVHGYVQLALDIRFLKEWVKQGVDGTYVQLVQQVSGNKPLILASDGQTEYLESGVVSQANVAGTSWTVQVFLPPVISVSAFNLVMIIVLVIALGLAGIAIFLLYRQVSTAIRSDLENIIRMTADNIKGIKAHEYNLHMPEFREAAKLISNLQENASMERERDDDPNAISMSTARELPQIDPLFMSSDSLAVEEISTPTPVKESPAPASTATGTANTTLPPVEIFKAYDIRGIVGQSLTPAYVEQIGHALGSEAIDRGLKQIAFARDGRLSGPELGQALVKGLQQAGMEVTDVGMVPTPVLYYAAAELTGGTGVMLTGSHNPPNYNGLKMVLGGETLAGDSIQGLRQRIEQQNFTSGQGTYKTLMLLDKYIQRIVSDVKLKRKLKVAVDCGNGVAGVVAPKLLTALGCEVTEMYCDVDGRFPNHHPDPSKPENLRDLIEMVKSQDADLGLAFDGDGDRLGVVSPDGKIIWPDRLMMLFVADVLSRNHGAKIIFDIKCSSNLTRVIWEKGGEPLMWKTGHSLIKAKMRDTGALLAGEMSGHIFFKERWYGFDDGLYAMARLLEILAADMRKPRVVFAGLPDTINTPELNVPMPEGEHFRFMDKMLAKAEFGNANVTMIDGIRADYEDGWGLVRASNTTPCLVIRFEGKNKEAMQRIQDKFRKVMLDIEPGLKLPF